MLMRYMTYLRYTDATISYIYGFIDNTPNLTSPRRIISALEIQYHSKQASAARPGLDY